MFAILQGSFFQSYVFLVIFSKLYLLESCLSSGGCSHIGSFSFIKVGFWGTGSSEGASSSGVLIEGKQVLYLPHFLGVIISNLFVT